MKENKNASTDQCSYYSTYTYLKLLEPNGYKEAQAQTRKIEDSLCNDKADGEEKVGGRKKWKDKERQCKERELLQMPLSLILVLSKMIFIFESRSSSLLVSHPVSLRTATTLLSLILTRNAPTITSTAARRQTT